MYQCYRRRHSAGNQQFCRTFEGETTGSNFKWRPDADNKASDPPDGCDVGSVVEKVVGEQINTNFFYKYDKTTGILEFSGHIGDAPGRGRFNSLIAQLQRFMKNGCPAKTVFAPTQAKGETSAQLQKFSGDGCTTNTAFSITKIAFVAKITVIEKLLFNKGFEWQICEPPSSCECAGECRTCPLLTTDDGNISIKH